MSQSVTLPGPAPRTLGPRDNVIIVAMVLPEEFKVIAPRGDILAVQPVLRALRNHLALEKLLDESGEWNGAYGGGLGLECSVYLFDVLDLQRALLTARDELQYMGMEQIAVIGFGDGDGRWQPWHPKDTTVDLNKVVAFATSDRVHQLVQARIKLLRAQIDLARTGSNPPTE